MAWDPDGPWRQGDFLTPAASVTLGLLTAADATMRPIAVISHSCDIARPAAVESDVEIVIGEFVDRIDGNHAYGRNARNLHLQVTGGNNPRIVSFTIASRRSIRKEAAAGAVPKTALEGHAPSADWKLSSDETKLLQRWLSMRYAREAFSNEFNNLFKATGVADRVARIVDRSGDHIAVVYFDVDRQVEGVPPRNADDPIPLEITLVYSTSGEEPELSRETTEAAKTEIRQAFVQRCQNDGRWHSIELVDVNVIADEKITLKQVSLLQRWNTGDYLSVRDDPNALLQD